MTIKRSSYYSWLKSSAKIHPAESFEIYRLAKEMFNASRESMGTRRISKRLKFAGFNVGRYKVRKIMHKLRLFVKFKRRFKNTTMSKHGLPVAKNILNREFNPSKANHSWGADITYIPTKQGFTYLSAVIDFYSRRVVGWHISENMKAESTAKALSMAINYRQPEAGLIHHSDRGVQYASKEYQSLLKQHGIIASMSRKGNCWDNAPIERFFGSLKREWINGEVYDTIDDARRDVREFVSVYYNAERSHSTLGYLTPMEFEKCV